MEEKKLDISPFLYIAIMIETKTGLLDWEDFWNDDSDLKEEKDEETKIIDYTEVVPVKLTRSDWNWFVTLMTDSINKMELAVEKAGMDAQGFLTIDVLRTIRNEIAAQTGLDHVAGGDASEPT